MALEVSSNGITDYKIATIKCPSLNITIEKPEWVTTATTSSSAITISVGENEDVYEKSGTVLVKYNGCQKGFHIHQAGSIKNTMYMEIRNNSNYISDFSNIVLTVHSDPEEVIEVLENISELPVDDTSNPISYKQKVIGTRITCTATVRNEIHPSGDIITLPCGQGYCDPGEGDTVTFKYTGD